MLFSHFNDFTHGADITIHGINRFKGNDLRRIGRQACQFAIQIFRIIMLPDHLFGPRMADALDHAGVIKLIRQDHCIGQTPAQGAESRPV